jgi:hypothetical protein
MNNKIQCKICNKYLSFVSNTHLKLHNITPNEYKDMYPDAKFKSDELRQLQSKLTKGKSYEERYGESKSVELKKIRSIAATKQMTDTKQIELRRDKCGAPEYYTDVRRSNMSAAITDATIKRRLATIHKNIELGVYTTRLYGRQSNIARKFIKQFIQDNNINDLMCYYDGGGITSNEYYSIAFNPITNRKKSIAFDLVITADGKHDIDTIIEINGPWHWRYDEVLADPLSPSCPLSTNKYTKLESYNIDAIKINKALEISKKVFILWLDINKMIQITSPIKLINNE